MLSLIKHNNQDKEPIFNQFPSFFDDVFTREFFGKPTKRILNNTVPSVNIKETDKSFELEMAAPGMEKNDFKIELNKDRLTISAEKENSKEEKDEQHKFTRKEFSYQSFSRSFILPEDVVDFENINASYNNGILNISIPKKETKADSSARKIQIS